ncbi:hypothetical protein C8Q79DRAFT_920178 [Trametes meyenii]|nr:hypothetical protein C8Q79DRAFT_920178 [Trametes meyenii]
MRARSSAAPKNKAPESPVGASPRDDWPAPETQMSAARAFLIECAASDSTTLLLPDKDADGLTSGLIVYLTLLHLGLAPSRISAHFPDKGTTIHAPHERATNARYVIATDQGSRGGPPLLGVNSATTKTLVIDHHWSTAFPEGAVVCSAARSPPVATSSTLAYELCLPLLENGPEKDDGALRERLAYLCAIGTMGDLGAGFRWEPPFPDMRTCFKRWTKKVLGEAVALLNAPRRTPEYDVPTAWRALLGSSSPRALVDASSSNPDVRRLFAARASITAEVKRCAHNPPVFSGDGRVALVRISSAAQVHPLIATRWASSLKGARLAIVMCANSGYLPGMTNFACRVARVGGGNLGMKRKTGDEEGGTDIIETLKDYAGRVSGLTEAMGDDFARGHKQASGGIVRTEDFEKLWDVMSNANQGNEEFAAKRRKVDGKAMPVQKNTLEGWLKKS